jgi:hypothetical protein
MHSAYIAQIWKNTTLLAVFVSAAQASNSRIILTLLHDASESSFACLLLRRGKGVDCFVLHLSVAFSGMKCGRAIRVKAAIILRMARQTFSLISSHLYA